MSGIAAAIIIPPSGSSFYQIAPGSQGEESFRRISVVQRIAPLREDGRDRHARPRPDDAAISRERNNRQNCHPSSPGVYRSVTITPGGPCSSTWEVIRAKASSAFSYWVTCKPSCRKNPDSSTS